MSHGTLAINSEGCCLKCIQSVKSCSFISSLPRANKPFNHRLPSVGQSPSPSHHAARNQRETSSAGFGSNLGDNDDDLYEFRFLQNNYPQSSFIQYIDSKKALNKISNLIAITGHNWNSKLCTTIFHKKIIR